MTQQNSDITPLTLRKYVSKTDGGNYVLRSPCGTFKFPGQLELSGDELDKRCEWTMYPQYRCFYVCYDQDEDRYRLITDYVEKCLFFSSIQVNDLFEGGSFEDAREWSFKNYEMVKCLCDAYDYNDEARKEWEAKRAEEVKEATEKLKEQTTSTRSSAANDWRIVYPDENGHYNYQPTNNNLKTSPWTFSFKTPLNNQQVPDCCSTPCSNTKTVSQEQKQKANDMLMDAALNMLTGVLAAPKSSGTSDSSQTLNNAVGDILSAVMTSFPKTTTESESSSEDESMRVKKTL